MKFEMKILNIFYLSDERVIWSNPDDEDQEMKPITPHNLNHH